MIEQNFRERRKHARLLLALPMQVQWAGDKGIMLSEDFKSVNISAGGVYYKSREGLPLETNTTVTFDLPFHDTASFGILRTRGRVVRVEETETEGKGIALKFMEELIFSTPSNNLSN